MRKNESLSVNSPLECSASPLTAVTAALHTAVIRALRKGDELVCDSSRFACKQEVSTNKVVHSRGDGEQDYFYFSTRIVCIE